MNIYEHEFMSVCPVDGDEVRYYLTIETNKVIPAEDIRAACARHGRNLHEPIAFDLDRTLPGKQTLVAMHRDVRITTIRWRTGV